MTKIKNTSGQVAGRAKLKSEKVLPINKGAALKKMQSEAHRRYKQKVKKFELQLKNEEAGYRKEISNLERQLKKKELKDKRDAIVAVIDQIKERLKSIPSRLNQLKQTARESYQEYLKAAPYIRIPGKRPESSFNLLLPHEMKIIDKLTQEAISNQRRSGDLITVEDKWLLKEAVIRKRKSYYENLLDSDYYRGSTNAINDELKHISKRRPIEKLITHFDNILNHRDGGFSVDLPPELLSIIDPDKRKDFKLFHNAVVEKFTTSGVWRAKPLVFVYYYKILIAGGYIISSTPMKQGISAKQKKILTTAYGVARDSKLDKVIQRFKVDPKYRDEFSFIPDIENIFNRLG